MKRRLTIIILIILILLSSCGKKTDGNKLASIDFGIEGFEIKYDIEKIEIDEVDPDIDIFAYKFNLEEEIDYAVEITIPYEIKGMSEEEQLKSVVGKYYNETTKEWEDVFYKVNPEDKTVTILTDHFSTYSVFVIKNEAKRSAHISGINDYALYLPSEDAHRIFEIYTEQGLDWEKNLMFQMIDAGNASELGIFSDVVNFMSLGGQYSVPFVSSMSDKLGNLGIATASARFAYDAYNNGLTSVQTNIDAMKLVLNLSLNFATPAIQLAFVGVNAIDMALSEVSTFAIETKYKSTKNMYDEYYKRPENSRTAADWYKIFIKYYEENKDNGVLVNDLIEKEINRYTNQYWEVAETDWESWIDAFDKNGNLSKYPWPSQTDRENISNHFKSDLKSYLTSPLLLLSRRAYFDSLDQRRKAYEEYRQDANRIISFTIKEDPDKDGNYEWGNAYFSLGPIPEEFKKNDWTIKLNEKSEGVLKFTVLAHYMAQYPMELYLYKTKENYEKDIVDKKFNVAQIKAINTNMTLNKRQEQIDYSGTYTGTLYNTSTSKETGVTTTVTHVNPFGDGAMYKIVVQSNESESTYIRGEYFVRNTGVANIAGADFRFSNDGTSFEANMIDNQDKVWGIITGSR